MKTPTTKISSIKQIHMPHRRDVAAAKAPKRYLWASGTRDQQSRRGLSAYIHIYIKT